jgi:hypothetical protein
MKGESKIILTVGTYFAVGHTAGWAWRDTHGLHLYYHRGAGETMIVDLCRHFCAINLDNPLFIYTKEQQMAVVLFLRAEAVLRAEMHRKISVQHGNSVM